MENFKEIFILLLVFIFVSRFLFLETIHNIIVWIGKYMINESVYAANNSV